MTAQQLKNSILQMAVQGKLVPQDPNDEPASVLLERIRAEKERLIKEKKIKREKNPSVIFKGADNTPYEKIGEEVRSLADEVPFDIPDSWEWVRLGSAFAIEMGQSPAGNTVSGNCNGTEFHQGKVFFGEKYIKASDQYTSSPTKFAPENSVLLCVRAPVGKVNITDRQLCIGRGLCAIIPLAGMPLLFAYYLLAAYENIFVKQATGTTFVAITAETVKNQLVPVPPLAEQQRIADLIERLVPYVNEYGKAESAVDRLNCHFPEVLKKSILQEAVQGKLVPQDPSDEPAEALLERIRAEKQRLIKEGKIKKDKHESVIFRRDNSHYEKHGSEEVCIDDEIPFEIPENWAWARLSSFGVFSSGKTPSMSNPQFWNGNIPWVTSKDMKRPVITDSEMHISELAASSMQLYPAGTLLLVARSGILKRLLPLCKLGIDSTINQDIKAFSLYDIELSEWLFYGIKAFEPYILKELVKSVTTVESLKFDEFSAMLIPVPPLSEQRRIIAAIKTAMNLLTPLSSNPLFSL